MRAGGTAVGWHFTCGCRELFDKGRHAVNHHYIDSCLL
ncbi:hypothetical protein LHK_03145 [Laribacter hongkongensis HLHK9]|uniref:Uncharacterized protein n=1 Tax=Laribacter hongkongensis (strain HLHK9) TaxID=557598 RepID=C1D689_LARHH|nr:hypothetical protein LHK_03145 [Laribacter hongkongensis HLHK9]